jgi:hypothetical protein
MNSYFTARVTRPVIATVIAGACFGAVAVPLVATMGASAATSITATPTPTPTVTMSPNDTQWG